MKLEPFYLVIARIGGGAFIPEQFLENKFGERDAIVGDICAGHHEDIAAVLRVVPQGGTVTDETVEIMEDVLAKRVNEHGNIPFNVREILEDHLGCRAVAEAERSLAA